jgi:6-phosphogluconolactonase
MPLVMWSALANDLNMTTKNFDLTSFATPDELALAVAGAWLDEIESANRAGKAHTVALSGGRITQKFFAATVEQARVRAVDFSRVHFFWADERCVPPGDPDSNFKMADELLLEPLKISAAQIHRLRGEAAPAEAVKSAEAELQKIIPAGKNNLPALDLIFLGMGEDGHVASLFPVTSFQFLDKSVPFLVVENSPKPPPTRISLSYKMIFTAKNIWILVSGAGKENAFRESIAPNGQTPMAQVIQARKNTRIFSDLKK